MWRVRGKRQIIYTRMGMTPQEKLREEDDWRVRAEPSMVSMVSVDFLL